VVFGILIRQTTTYSCRQSTADVLKNAKSPSVEDCMLCTCI